jgi:hypothetical protein
MSLLMDAQNLRHNQVSFVRYLDICTLANRLNMNSLKSWAQSQIGRFFEFTAYTWVSESTWDKQSLLEIAAFGKSSPKDIDDGIQALLRSILTPSSALTPPYLETCVSLYKDPIFSKISDALFGWIFAFILSLGHRSSVWLNDLTRDDRLVLYTAQAELTNLSQHSDLRIAWLIGEKLPTFWVFDMCCQECLSHCKTVWSSSFGQVGELNSMIPLEDIRKIIRLCEYRQMFAQGAHFPTWPCWRGCARGILRSVDEHTNLLFRDLSKLYTYCVEYVLFLLIRKPCLTIAYSSHA